MSKSSIKRIISLLFVFAVSVALLSADLVVSAQNENDTTRGGQMTSNTQTGNMTGGNANTGGRRRRRRRSSATVSAEASANMTADTGNGNMSAEATGNMSTGRRRRRGRRRGAGAGATVTTGTTTTNVGGEQTDLTGSYLGKVESPELGLSGNANLTIAGNNFTVTPDTGSPASGRVTAVTTRGYTAVAMMFGDLTPPPAGTAPPPLPAVSLRARGHIASLTKVSGEKREFSFVATGSSGTGRVRSRRRGRRRARSTAGNANMGGGGGGNMNMSTGNMR